MNPPSSGGGDGSGQGNRSNSINSMAFCHECGIEIRPLMTPDPTCPRCNGQFVEIIDENSAQDFEEEANHPFAALGGGPFPGFSFHTAPLPGVRGGTASLPLSSVQGGGSPLAGGLGELLIAMASGAGRGADQNTHTSTSPNSDSNRNAPNDGGNERRSSESQSNTTRSGSTSFGPFGLQWNVQYDSGGGDPYQRAAQHQAEQNQRYQQPPTLSNFLRFAFGSGTTDDEQPSRNRQRHDDEYFHDDGMGGAGGVADGRHFNHDNRGRYHQPQQSPENESNHRSGTGGGNSDLPPELSALRNLFTGLFGDPGAQGTGGGGSLLDFLAAGAQVGGGGGGPRGQWGDYVLGQQGLDDIISQLMEQAQGSNAPPPATEDVIERLERFTNKDKERIEKAKNQDCPTCKDDFLPTSADEQQEESKDGKEKEAEAGKEEQQEDLISMPCGHIFHVDCLVPWLRLHGTCPVCRVSIAKPQEKQTAGTTNNSGTANTNTSGSPAQTSNTPSNPTADPADSVPGSWPGPPNPFTSFFNQLSGQNIPRPEETIRVTHEPPNTTTTTYHPQPPASTTITSTSYSTPAPAPAPSAGGRSGTGLVDVEVVNSIVSSPPIVSDREEFFGSPRGEEGPEHSRGRDEEGRENMREMLRRAAEARIQSGGGSGHGEEGTRSGQGPSLEPDELD
ncbi:hypothetical protein NDA10_006448 [Ustilago hordei]|nr:hypothetical protein NDA10_006448 [Ustilago hordei]UTT89707.1 hypothetical protein NDA17_000315 [Ustilago hordei]